MTRLGWRRIASTAPVKPGMGTLSSGFSPGGSAGEYPAGMGGGIETGLMLSIRVGVEVRGVKKRDFLRCAAPLRKNCPGGHPLGETLRAGPESLPKAAASRRVGHPAKGCQPARRAKLVLQPL